MKFSIPAMSRANEFNLNDTKYWLPSSANTKGQGSVHQVILRHYVATRIRQKSLCLKAVSGLESPEIKCITSVRERHPMSTAKPWRIVHHTFNASVLKSRVLDPTFCQHI